MDILSEVSFEHYQCIVEGNLWKIMEYVAEVIC